MLACVAIRLVLAEDSYLAREGLRRLLETRPGVEVVADCGDLLALFDGGGRADGFAWDDAAAGGGAAALIVVAAMGVRSASVAGGSSPAEHHYDGCSPADRHARTRLPGG
jgi:hypothetical protein